MMSVKIEDLPLDFVSVLLTSNQKKLALFLLFIILGDVVNYVLIKFQTLDRLKESLLLADMLLIFCFDDPKNIMYGNLIIVSRWIGSLTSVVD